MDQVPIIPASTPVTATFPTTATFPATATFPEAQNHIAHETLEIPSVFHTINQPHPPYAEMIYAAITALKERDGSSKRAIAKYIERVYSGLPSTHSDLLTQHLKHLKDNGLLVMVKKSYKLPGSDPSSSPAVPPAASPMGRRGRPPKPNNNSTAQPVLVSLGLVDEPASVKPGRGRPRKSGTVEVANGGPVGQKRRGRPPGSNTKNRQVVPYAVKRSPGRPPKSQPQQTFAIPYAPDVVAPVQVEVVSAPKPRGRPKKNAAVTFAPGTAFSGATHRVSSGRRPGRPPKTGGVKRPVGRPKKNDSMARSEVPNSEPEAYGDFKRKIEYFQSKIKEAVGVIKPHLANESAFDANVAIHELEVLATMDVDAPLKDQIREVL